jgi:peroxiredoxin
MKTYIRKIIGGTLIVAALALTCFFVVKILELQKIKAIKEQQMDILPDFCLTDLSDSLFCTTGFAHRPAVLVIFDPNCNACEQEINGIYDNKAAFSNITIAMVTVAGRESCEAFYIHHKLGDVPNLQILRDSTGAFMRMVGMQGVPETFVYNSNKNLIQKFAGEVKAITILKTIHESD